MGPSKEGAVHTIARWAGRCDRRGDRESRDVVLGRIDTKGALGRRGNGASEWCDRNSRPPGGANCEAHGARKVIATGRNPIALEKLGAIGADVTIPLAQPREDLEAAFKRKFASEGIDVVLDYLWGASAEVLLVAAAKAGKNGAPIRFVQVGGASGFDITLPCAVLRSSALELMGSGLGSIPLEGLVGATREMLQAAVPSHFQIETQTVPLADIEKVWKSAGGVPRTVFITT